MTQEKILARLRAEVLDDEIEPYNWSDATLVDHLNDAIEELCEDCFLISDSSTTDICQVIIGYKAENVIEGTNSATVEIVNDIDYIITGSNYTLTAQDNVAMTACTVQAVSTYCRYLLSVDTLGAVTVTKGTSATTDAGAKIPLLPSGKCPIGVLLIATDGTHTFTSGTTDLSATGITDTFEDAPTQFLVDSRVIKIDRVKPNGAVDPLGIKTVRYMDATYSDWENTDESTPSILVSGKDRDYYMVWPQPDKPDKLVLTVYRRPLTDLTEDDNSAEPEIPDQYHRKLFHGVAYRCYGKQHSESYDPEKRKDHYALWQQDIESIKRSELKRDMHGGETCAVPLGTT